MADIPQVLATYDALLGVALGAGLTYWFSALSRRHQEKREDATRWYEKRLQAYAEFHNIVYRISVALRGEQPLRKGDRESLNLRLLDCLAAVSFVGSDEVTNMASTISDLAQELEKEIDFDVSRFSLVLGPFEAVARKDLGHPSP